MLKQFYPTPRSLLEKVMQDVDWNEVSTVLEPEAGNGDIVDFIMEQCSKHYRRNIDVDCIEIDETRRSTLIGKDYRVVHDDFLTYRTFKQYSMIVMNPPFTEGEKHLRKALDMQRYGGSVLCILNAETIKNPYTNSRKQIERDLNEAGASIEYIQGAFSNAERETDVEVAVVKVSIPKKEWESEIFKKLKEKYYTEAQTVQETSVTVGDVVKAAVVQYNLEVESGIKLIYEYEAMAPHMLHSLDKDVKYNDPILRLCIGSSDYSINEFVKAVRRKYWGHLFRDSRFTAGMTSAMCSAYLQKVNELCKYDFSEYNIKEIQIEMSKHMIQGVEECILHLFEKLTQEHSWYPECERNIHYFNGWSTNKAWIINKKVILPIRAFSEYSWSNKEFRPRNCEAYRELLDMEKVFNYLDGCMTAEVDMDYQLGMAEAMGQTKNIRLKYFNVTFYKKGTCHITFTNPELLKKFNIFAARQRKWLPQEYGRRAYREMNREEQQVIDSFEGEESYNQTVANADYFLYNPHVDILMLEQYE